jgi:hypothetical protein
MPRLSLAETPETRPYVVREGDYIAKLAERFGSTST